MINTTPPGTVSETFGAPAPTDNSMKFIALAIVLTFVFTAIVVTLLVLVLVWLYMTCKEKRKDKYQLNSDQTYGSKKPIELTNPYWEKNN